MKKVIFNFAIFSLIAIAFASCQKEEKALKTEFGAQYDNEAADAKTVYNDGVFSWSDNDKVKIYDNEEHSGVYTVYPGSVNPFYASIRADETTVTEESAPYIGIFPASAAIAKDTVVLPTTQYCVSGEMKNVPMIAVTDNDQMRFKNLCGALRIRLHQDGVKVRRIVLTTDKVINGIFDVSLDENNIPTIVPSTMERKGYTVNGSYSTALICDSEQDIGGEGHIFYLYLPAGQYQDMNLTLFDDHGKIASKTAHNITITRSKYTKVAIEGDLNFSDPVGALPGLFSVRPDRKVRFSKGNLQVKPSTNEWRFAEHQYDYVGASNFYASDRTASFIDLFPFGSSGYNGIQPYARNRNKWNDPTVYYKVIRNIVGTQYDWGLHNPISNGGEVAGMWFTLSSSEWGYLLYCRPGALDKQGIGTVNNVKGQIILPDDFTYPAGCPVLPRCTFANGAVLDQFGNNWSYDRVTYTADQWAQMEANGAAFLPAAGWIGIQTNNNSTNYQYINFRTLTATEPVGFYWSSARWLYLASVNYSVESYQSVITMSFVSGRNVIGQFIHHPGNAGCTNPDHIMKYYECMAVRLVQDENMVNVMPEYYIELDPPHPHDWD